MFILFTTFSDYIGSLSLLAMLAVLYGHLHRALVRPRLGEALLGGCFGLIAAAQMHMPIEPMPGMIVDLRNAPIILCAAFLNWRASLVCLMVAMATRLNIGGIGMWSGLLGMIVAAGAGATWARLFKGRGRRGFWPMLSLSIIGSSHLFAAIVLPEPAFSWFLNNAVAPILELNLMSITAVALLIEAEQARFKDRDRLVASAAVDPDHGIMSPAVMMRELALRIGAGDQVAPQAVLRVRLRRMPLMTQFLTEGWNGRLLGLVHKRVKGVLPPNALVAGVGKTDLVVPLDREQMQDVASLKVELRRAVRERCFRLAMGVQVPIAIDVECVAWTPEQPLEAALAKREPIVGMPKRATNQSARAPSAGSGVAADIVETLFRTAQSKMAAEA